MPSDCEYNDITTSNLSLVPYYFTYTTDVKGTTIHFPISLSTTMGWMSHKTNGRSLNDDDDENCNEFLSRLPRVFSV